SSGRRCLDLTARGSARCQRAQGIAAAREHSRRTLPRMRAPPRAAARPRTAGMTPRPPLPFVPLARSLFAAAFAAAFAPPAPPLSAQEPPKPQEAPKPQPKPQEVPKPAEPPRPALPKLDYKLLLEHPEQVIGPGPVVRFFGAGHDAAMEVRDAGEHPTVRIVLRGPGQAEPKPVADAAAVRHALGLPPAAEPPPLPEWSRVDAGTLRLELPGAVWVWKVGEEKAARVLQWPTALDARDEGRPFALAAGDQRVAYLQQHDLNVCGRDGAARRITWDGSQDVVYGGAAHRAEFGIQGGLFWSPDAKRLAFYREDQRGIAPYPYQDLAA